MTLLRVARRSLAGGRVRMPAGTFARHAEAWRRARLLVQVYDWLQLAFVMQTVSWLPRIIRGKPELLWPVAWVDEVGVVTGAVALLGVTVVLAAAAVAGVSPRLCRGLAAVGFAMLVALDCSFGKITHHWHAWFFTGFVLALSDTEPAPLGVRRRLHVQRNLTVFWFAFA